MGQRSLIAIATLLVGAGGAAIADPAPRAPSLSDHVVADFERAVLTSQDAYVALFNFVDVGEFEILLHRYDLYGRVKNLNQQQKDQFASEDGTPYPETRERRNVGKFYPILAQRTVGTGGCVAAPPRTRYGRLLGIYFDPLPPNTPPGYDKLRTDANAWLAKGGVIGIHCSGGKGGVAVVYTAKDAAPGYELLTIYDD